MDLGARAPTPSECKQQKADEDLAKKLAKAKAKGKATAKGKASSKAKATAKAMGAPTAAKAEAEAGEDLPQLWLDAIEQYKPSNHPDLEYKVLENRCHSKVWHRERQVAKKRMSDGEAKNFASTCASKVKALFFKKYGHYKRNRVLL